MSNPPKFNLDHFKVARSNHLSAIDVLGSFDFYTACISLDSIQLPEVESMHKVALSLKTSSRKLTPEDYLAISTVWPLAVHEFTHFFDSTSTVWGLNFLSSTSMAYSSWATGDESSFAVTKAHSVYLRSLRLPSYYTEIHSAPVATKIWRYQISTGKIFAADGSVSKRPVIFCRFNNEQGECMVRSPLTMISLLEASAMAQELFSSFDLLRMSGDVSYVETPIVTSKILARLYNKNLTEYSVCVHLVANHLKCPDVIQAFMVTSEIVRAVLNFPSAYFDKIDIKSVSAVLGVPEGHELAQDILHGLQLGDRAILFYLVCSNLPQGCERSPADAKQGVMKAIESLGQDNKGLAIAAAEEVLKLAFEKIKGESPSMQTLKRIGFENFISSTQGNHQWQLHWRNLHIPPVALGDCEIVSISGISSSPIAKIEFFEECYDHLSEGRNWVERFSEACL